MWTVAQDRMTVIAAMTVMIALSKPGLPEASKSASPTAIRLVTLARIKDEVGRRPGGVFDAGPWPRRPCLRRSTRQPNTTAAISQPMSTRSATS